MSHGPRMLAPALGRDFREETKTSSRLLNLFRHAHAPWRSKDSWLDRLAFDSRSAQRSRFSSHPRTTRRRATFGRHPLVARHRWASAKSGSRRRAWSAHSIESSSTKCRHPKKAMLIGLEFLTTSVVPGCGRVELVRRPGIDRPRPDARSINWQGLVVRQPAAATTRDGTPRDADTPCVAPDRHAPRQDRSTTRRCSRNGHRPDAYEAAGVLFSHLYRVGRRAAVSTSWLFCQDLIDVLSVEERSPVFGAQAGGTPQGPDGIFAGSKPLVRRVPSDRRPFSSRPARWTPMRNC